MSPREKDSPPAPPDWESIFTAFDLWRRTLSAPSADGAAGAEPSVSVVAELYRADPWAVLASTILSLRTKDEVTLAASRRLLERAPDPAALLELETEVCAALIYPVGFYRTKAARLADIARILIDRYEGRVPMDMDALLALPGVGRKTANLVLAEAFGMDALCVDTHVHRISNRAGWVKSGAPDETERLLRERLPRRYWRPINPVLVLYGQRLCRPQSPFCSRCVIPAHCARRGVERSR